MSLVSFDALPDDARLWCFGASRTPEAAELQQLLDSMGQFVAEWTAHRRDLQASFSWVHERFLLVAVDESRAGASGCSIDALTGHLRDLGSELGLDLLDSMPVWFRDADGGIRAVSRSEFTRLGHAGEVSASYARVRPHAGAARRGSRRAPGDGRGKRLATDPAEPGLTLWPTARPPWCCPVGARAARTRSES